MKRRVVILSVVAMVSAWLGAAGPAAGSAGADYGLYFGDLHNHTRLSDGWDGTPRDAFVHARASGADWLWTSDHNFMLTQDEWDTSKRMAQRETSSRFVAAAGSEYWIATGFGEIIVNNVDELWNKANFRVGRPGLSRAEVIPVFYDWLASHPGAIGHWPASRAVRGPR